MEYFAKSCRREYRCGWCSERGQSLELVQHQLPESGHSSLLVTQEMLATTTR
jgi:hypothetical protein